MGIGDQAVPPWVGKVFRILVFTLGVALIAYGMAHFGVMGYPFIMGGMLCLIYTLYGLLGDAISGLFLPSGKHGPKPAQQYAVAHSLLAQHDYAGAEEELRRQRAAHPADVEGVRLLVELLATHRQRVDEALQLARSELAGASTWQHGHERLVLLAADICLDHQRRADACAFLRQGLQLNPERSAAKTLSDRLAALQG